MSVMITDVFDQATIVLASVQTEIVVFAFAICLHAMLFSRHSWRGQALKGIKPLLSKGLPQSPCLAVATPSVRRDAPHNEFSILLKSVQQGTKGDIEKAMSVVSAMEGEMDEVLFIAIVEACMRVCHPDLLASFLSSQKRNQCVHIKSALGYASLIRAHSFMHDIDSVWVAWREMRERQIVPSCVALGCMVEALVTNSGVEAGYALIKEMNADGECRSLVNAVIYSSVLKGFAHCKRFDKCWVVYNEMLDQQITFSLSTFNTLFDACARNGEMVRVPGLMESMIEQGIQANLITYSAVIKGYCQEGSMQQALELLGAMRETTDIKADEVMYNTLLDGCARCSGGGYGVAVELLTQMQEERITPTNFTMSVFAKVASRCKKLDRAFQLCDEMASKHNFKLNVHVYSNLVQGCILNQDIDRAFTVLERMALEKVSLDTRTYAMLARACVGTKRVQDTIGLIRAGLGLQGAHPSLTGFGSGGAKPQDTAKQRSELPKELIMELLRLIKGMRSDGNTDQLIAQLLLELQHLPSFKFDPQLKQLQVQMLGRPKK